MFVIPSLFYIGYLLGVMTWAKLVQRWPQHAGKFITGAMLTWSTITLLSRKCASKLDIAVLILL